MPLLQAQRGQPLTEPPGPVQAQLDQQEGQVPARDDRSIDIRRRGLAAGFPLRGPGCRVPYDVSHAVRLSPRKILAL